MYYIHLANKCEWREGKGPLFPRDKANNFLVPFIKSEVKRCFPRREGYKRNSCTLEIKLLRFLNQLILCITLFAFVGDFIISELGNSY